MKMISLREMKKIKEEKVFGKARLLRGDGW